MSGSHRCSNLVEEFARILAFVQRSLATCALVTTAAILCTTTVRSEDSSPYKRWAIVSDAKSQQTGLPDLLTTTLSQKSMQLLERDAIGLTEQEQLFQELLVDRRSDQAVHRFGQRCNADALIVISADPIITNVPANVPAPAPTTETLRIRIYACAQAVRLGMITTEKQKALSSIDQLAEAIDRIRSQFPHGVRHAIGVSAIATKNLEKSYDFLAFKFHDLLTSSLGLSPGIAIVDFENARAIANENPERESLTGRVIPWLVEIDMQVSQVDKNGPARISFIARRIAKNDTQAFHSEAMLMDQASQWISQTLPDMLMTFPGEERGAALTVRKQIEAMQERADLFSRLGDFHHATELREACLLLDPNNFAQRRQILNDYQSQATVYVPSHLSSLNWNIQIPPEAYQVRRIALDHLQTMILNRSMDQPTAYQNLNYWCRYPIGSHLRSRFYREITRDDEERLREDRDFLQSVTPVYFQLQTSKTTSVRDRLLLEEQWSKLVWDMLCTHVNQEHFSADQMERIFEYVAAILPGEFATVESAALFVNAIPKHALIKIGANGPNPVTHEYRLEENEIAEVFRKIAQGSHPHLQIYGALGKLLLQSRKQLMILDKNKSNPDSAPPLDQELLRGLVQQANEQILVISKRPNATFVDSAFRYGKADYALTRLVALRDQMQQGLKSRSSMPLANSDPVTQLKETSLGRLTFEPLPIELEHFQDQKFEWVPGGADFDLIVGSQDIARVDKSGETKIIHQFAKNTRPQVKWDGANILLLAQDPQAVWEFLDDRGNLSLELDPVKAFPTFETLHVLAVAAHQWLVVGRLEKDTRCWLAMLDLSGQSPQVQVFHEARRPINFTSVPPSPQEAVDTKWVVHPAWLGRFRRDGKEYLLLSRYGVSPLTIELPSLKVGALALPAISFVNRPIHLNGQLVFAMNDAWSYDLGTPQGELMVGKRVIPWVAPHDQERGVFSAGNAKGILLEHDGWIYLPGYAWHRFRPNLQNMERLVPTRLPHEYGQLDIHKSEVFGLVGVRSSMDGSTDIVPAVYRISVTE